MSGPTTASIQSAISRAGALIDRLDGPHADFDEREDAAALRVLTEAAELLVSVRATVRE